MRRTKVAILSVCAIGCLVVILGIVNERNHCPLKAHLPEDSELVLCEYEGFIDFMSVIEAKGSPRIKKEFTDNILESNPELQLVATGNAGWHAGFTWTEERSGSSPFDFYQSRSDEFLAIGYEDGVLTVIYDSW